MNGRKGRKTIPSPSGRAQRCVPLSPGTVWWGGDLPCEQVGVKKSGEKKTNKHKQLHRIVPEMGGGQIVYVFPFFLGKRETHKQNSQEISGKGRDSPG